MKRLLICTACSVALAGCASILNRHDQTAGTQQASPGLYTDCVTAAVVGLRWNSPAGTRLAAKTSRYELTRDGAPLGETSETYFADTTVAESKHYAYVVREVSSGNEFRAELDTPPASPNGDAPYCKSQHIETISWNWSTAHNEPNGSDLWPVTWGKDGKVYTFFGDGGGFGGDNYRGRSSFGIATMTGPPPPSESSRHNIYGGYNSAHPSTVAGKAGSIIAVGSDFYTLGGMYKPAEIHGDPNRVSRAPNRIQLAYSKGNAHSWQPAAWTFCSRDGTPPQSRFCPHGFINYGPGNAGAIDGQVYLVGHVNEESYWRDIATLAGASTYLARVPGKHVLNLQAYRYFAGLDARGKPIWSADPQQMRPIFTDRNPSRPGCGSTCNMASPIEDVVYNPGIKRYIATAQGDYVGQTSFYDAPHPWGPWTTISYNNIDPATGTGGWANLGTAGGFGLGVHVVNAWTSPDGLNLWLTYSSDGKAPPGAQFPPQGTMLDSFNLVSASLIPGPALRGLRASR